MNKKVVGIYSLIHFVVDLSCAILVTNLVTQKMGQNTNLFIAILIYNFFAFAMQFPIGIIADKVNKNSICSAIGCIISLNYNICYADLVAPPRIHSSGGDTFKSSLPRVEEPATVDVASMIIIGVVIAVIVVTAIIILAKSKQEKDKEKNDEK